METVNEEPQIKLSNKLLFNLFGVASLLGSNAILTELTLFNNFLNEMNPYVSFPFYIIILNIFFQFLLFCKRDLFPLKFQLYTGIIGSIVFLILIPLCVINLEKNSFINKFTTGGLVVLMGFINALCSGGFYNLESNFPYEMIVALATGQGFSGIGMNVIQYIVLLSIKGDDDDAIILQAWIFFSISIFILLICLILLFISFNNEYFQYYLNKSKKDNISGLLSEETEEEGKLNVVEDRSEKRILNFWEIFVKIWDLDLLILYVYIVTFGLFPNASINQYFFNISTAYRNNTILFIYNFFDTVGRFIVEKLPSSKKLNMITILSRSILLFTLIFNYYCYEQLNWNGIITSILLIINVGLLGFSNGIGNTLCFGLAPKEVEDQYKGQAGNSVSFFLILGILLGTCLGFGTDAIINTFKKKY